MTTEFINPPTLPAPVGPYSQLALTDGPGRWLHIAGQVGVEDDGSIPDDAARQGDLAWGAIHRALEAAEMDMSHVVKVTVFVVHRADLAPLREVRLRHIGASRPASTLVLVAGLVDERFKVEVEAVAFKPLAAA